MRRVLSALSSAKKQETKVPTITHQSDEFDLDEQVNADRIPESKMAIKIGEIEDEDNMFK